MKNIPDEKEPGIINYNLGQRGNGPPFQRFEGSSGIFKSKVRKKGVPEEGGSKEILRGLWGQAQQLLEGPFQLAIHRRNKNREAVQAEGGSSNRTSYPQVLGTCGQRTAGEGWGKGGSEEKHKETQKRMKMSGLAEKTSQRKYVWDSVIRRRGHLSICNETIDGHGADVIWGCV